MNNPDNVGSEMTFTATEKAIVAMNKQSTEREKPSTGIRIGLRAGGCSGYSYVFEWTDKEPSNKDHIFVFDGVQVFIDPKSMIYLNKTELDYETTLMWRGFKFNNPNTKGSGCGCGSSVDF
jgi:iron-sulfur cluster assembly protein